jgi:hypothetical protein
MGRWAKFKVWTTINLYRTFNLPKTAQQNVRHNKNDEFFKLAFQGMLLSSAILKHLTEMCIFWYLSSSWQNCQDYFLRGFEAAYSGRYIPTFKGKLLTSLLV